MHSLHSMFYTDNNKKEKGKRKRGKIGEMFVKTLNMDIKHKCITFIPKWE